VAGPAVEGPHLILYDGLCGLCNRSNQFVLRRDHADRFRFASLQSAFAREVLRRFGQDGREMTTLYVVPDYTTAHARFLSRSEAVLFILDRLGGLWRGARLLRVMPRAARDALYRFVSANRYRWFGEYDECPLPTPETRRKFVATE
jgi:predicted DCC family thiol-disulfide oxidoreductase YuxK